MSRRVVHWLLSPASLNAFCGKMAYLNTARKEKVTCGNCRRLMRLHGHLPEEES